MLIKKRKRVFFQMVVFIIDMIALYIIDNMLSFVLIMIYTDFELNNVSELGCAFCKPFMIGLLKKSYFVVILTTLGCLMHCSSFTSLFKFFHR